MTPVTVSPFAPPSLLAADSGLLRDALRGLLSSPKELPCKYFYDAEGSRLFDAICTLPEYYPTRCELAILERDADAIARFLGPDCTLIEYGSGSSVKTRLLLDRLERPAAYVPVDISSEPLYLAARRLVGRYPRLAVRPIVADFTRPFSLPELPGSRRVVYFSGSTIGNFTPGEALALLTSITRLIGTGGGLLIGVDLRKEATILHAAYNDAQGVTAAFNRNLLVRLNREAGADFDLAAFGHYAFYEPTHGRIEMHLVSRKAQTVHVGGVGVHFSRGESVRTEYSYKYGPEDFAALASRAGLVLEATWTDEDDLYSVHYLGAGCACRCQ
jgi:L-histidine N-alpha-methyltransferase